MAYKGEKMKLFRVADEMVAPTWAFEKSALDQYKGQTISPEDAQRFY